VLIRDYFRYLVSHRGFVVTDLEAVLFFKTEPIFNQIFRELIERRRSSQDFKEKNWIKRLVNLSCGFFGFQENGRSGFRHFSIRSRIPRTFNVSRHQIDFRQGAVCLDSTQYYVVSLGRRPRRRRRRCGPSNNALALFFTVVEMGKLRLVQALQFFSRHLPPASWSLLYSNVDNLIIALEGAGNLEEAVFLAAGSDGLARYLAEKPLYLAASSQEAEPGQLRLEWLCNSPSWRFITLGIMHYVLRDNGNHDDDDAATKNGGFVPSFEPTGISLRSQSHVWQRVVSRHSPRSPHQQVALDSNRASKHGVSPSRKFSSPLLIIFILLLLVANKLFFDIHV